MSKCLNSDACFNSQNEHVYIKYVHGWVGKLQIHKSLSISICCSLLFTFHMHHMHTNTFLCTHVAFYHAYRPRVQGTIEEGGPVAGRAGQRVAPGARRRHVAD